MIFKVEPLNKEVHCIRGYRKEGDAEYIFGCVLHRPKGKKEWQIKVTLSTGGTRKETMETLRFLRDYPGGTWTYVTEEDMERFYRRFCKRIKFDDCDF
ncbi:MAG: hypothetical protein KAS66_09440 [Candidatus Omnitrophica bacterium]|nr:hypothetical protein [Candidatus Omnitrophota bacterium]